MTWSRIGSRLAAEYRIFRTRWDNYRSPQGIEHEFVVLSSSDYVNVIALTPEQQVVMIRQYRHGVQEETWEIPGGLGILRHRAGPDLPLRDHRQPAGQSG